MRRLRHRRAFRRRYGRSYDRDSRGRLYGERPRDELLEEQGAQTVRVPRMTMAEQLAYDRRERESAARR